MSLATFFSRPVLAFNSSAEHPHFIEFANSRLWLKLLQYNSDGVSEVRNRTFFFAANGHTDAAAELAATLKAFAQTPATMCRFPARAQALRQAQLLTSNRAPSCPEYQEWLRTESVESITLVFADGYLKNPASFHGHLFLRIDSNRQGNGNLLDTSLNFGAVVPDNDDPITYIIKGLFGGYQARYSAQPYYRHNLSYGEVELRNLWDYQLNFDPSQSELLAAHLWELSHTDYQYFFTSKNCAYYVARAIEVVTKNDLVHHNEWTVLPTDIVQRLKQSDEGLVRSIEVNQSAQSTLQQRYHQLTNAEQIAVNDWVSRPQHEPQSFQLLSPTEKKRVLITLSAYYTFLERQLPDEHEPKQHKASVLRELLNFEPGNTLATATLAAPPHLGQPANLIRFTARHYAQAGNAFAATLRPSFYDRLQPSAGKLPNSALSMGEVEFTYIGQRLEIERLWLINIEALNMSHTGLPHDGGMSWMLRAGAERARLRLADPRLASFVEGGLGQARQFGALTPYAMLHGRLHTKESNLDSHHITLGLRAGFEFDWQGFKGYCELNQPVSVASQWQQQPLMRTCAASLFSHRHADVRIALAKQQEALAEIGFSLYF